MFLTLLFHFIQHKGKCYHYGCLYFCSFKNKNKKTFFKLFFQMWAQFCASHKCKCEIQATFFIAGNTFFGWKLYHLINLYIVVCSYWLNLTNSSKSRNLLLKIWPTLHGISWLKVLIENSWNKDCMIYKPPKNWLKCGHKEIVPSLLFTSDIHAQAFLTGVVVMHLEQIHLFCYHYLGTSWVFRR